MQVAVQIACEDECVPASEEIQLWADAAAQDSQGELTVRIVGEPEGRDLNERYRRAHGATNVLSFPFESPPGVSLDLIGDVVICAPVVKREAAQRSVAARAHFAHMVVHGVLHLFGHDHQHDDEARRMQGCETQLMTLLGFDDPYNPSGELSGELPGEPARVVSGRSATEPGVAS